jgi:hypothetical protein
VKKQDSRDSFKVGFYIWIEESFEGYLFQLCFFACPLSRKKRRENDRDENLRRKGDKRREIYTLPLLRMKYPRQSLSFNTHKITLF